MLFRSTGRALEVVAIETVTGLHVIHVMDLRPKWRPYYEKDEAHDRCEARDTQRHGANR